jgi:hypothetical protein
MTAVYFITVPTFSEGDLSNISCSRTITFIEKKLGGNNIIKSFSFQVGKERETEKGEREAEEGQGKGGERNRREREGEGRCEEGPEKGKLVFMFVPSYLCKTKICLFFASPLPSGPLYFDADPDLSIESLQHSKNKTS